MTNTLRVIHGARGTLPEDAPFSEFCAAAMRAAGGRDPDDDFLEDSCTEHTIQGRIAILERWTRANLPAWSVQQKPSARRAAIRPPILSAIDAWTGQCVLLAGLTGAGKTTAAVHLLLEFWERSIRRAIQVAATCQRPFRAAKWVSATKLERARREHELGKGEAELVTSAMKTDVLIIDDLGQEASRGDPVLFDVLNARYEQPRPTIVTTGLTVHEMADRYGTNLVRRLAQHARGFRIGEAW